VIILLLNELVLGSCYVITAFVLHVQGASLSLSFGPDVRSVMSAFKKEVFYDGQPVSVRYLMLKTGHLTGGEIQALKQVIYYF
jgi:hypothetical protein